MSADRKSRAADPGSAIKVAVLWGLFGCSGLVSAAEEELPDMEFLEYLGSWEESDEDWLVIDELTNEARVAEDKRSDPAPAGEESTESNDER